MDRALEFARIAHSHLDIRSKCVLERKLLFLGGPSNLSSIEKTSYRLNRILTAS